MTLPHDEHHEPELTSTVRRNIASLMEIRQQEERRRSISDRIADRVTAFVGSMLFVYIHVTVFGAWVGLNMKLIPAVKPWDPFPFVMLAVVTSVEAIFLSTFILITQNRMQRQDERRAELDLQISLLAEHELTRAIRLIDDIAVRMGVSQPNRPELEEIKKDVEPTTVMKEITKAESQKPPDKPGPAQ